MHAPGGTECVFPPSLALALSTSLATASCASTSDRAAQATTQHGAGIVVEVPDIAHPAGESAQWWFRNGAAQAAARGAMAGRARNVILFVGDGMSLTTVAAARILEGQRKGNPGEENCVVVGRLPGHCTEPDLQHQFADTRLRRYRQRDDHRREDPAGRTRHRPAGRAWGLRAGDGSTSLDACGNWPPPAAWPPAWSPPPA